MGKLAHIIKKKKLNLDYSSGPQRWLNAQSVNVRRCIHRVGIHICITLKFNFHAFVIFRQVTLQTNACHAGLGYG